MVLTERPLAFICMIRQLSFEAPKRWLAKTACYDEYWFEGTPCLCWLGWSDGKGHGKFSLNGKGVYVHRHSYELEHKIALAPERVVDHRCRHRPCWNPLHLEDVTSKENTDRGLGKLYQFKPDDSYADAERSTRELYEAFLRANGNCNNTPEYEELRAVHNRLRDVL